MKQVKILSIFMLVTMMATMFAGCSKDDDNSGNISNLNSYIIGTWRAYKCTIYAQGGAYNGQSADINIGKTGQYSDFYFECTFQEGGRIKTGNFKKDENGASRWFEDSGSYSINGDIVTIRDNEGEADDLVFSEKDKTLCFQMTKTEDGVPYKVILYMKK